MILVYEQPEFIYKYVYRYVYFYRLQYVSTSFFPLVNSI